MLELEAVAFSNEEVSVLGGIDVVLELESWFEPQGERREDGGSG